MRLSRLLVLGTALPFALLGCDSGGPTPAEPVDALAPALNGMDMDDDHDDMPESYWAGLTSEQRSWLTGLKGSLGRYHNFKHAAAGGYSALLTPCLSQPGVGGMGYHYGNPSLINGTVDPWQPEALVYAPKKNGKLQLVAVEYVVPLTMSATAPSVNGIAMHANPGAGLWVLHVWLFKQNPNGLLADWNPRVSCS